LFFLHIFAILQFCNFDPTPTTTTTTQQKMTTQQQNHFLRFLYHLIVRLVGKYTYYRMFDWQPNEQQSAWPRQQTKQEQGRVLWFIAAQRLKHIFSLCGCCKIQTLRDSIRSTNISRSLLSLVRLVKLQEAFFLGIKTQRKLFFSHPASDHNITSSNNDITTNPTDAMCPILTSCMKKSVFSITLKGELFY
jgi:hypothetical protein